MRNSLTPLFAITALITLPLLTGCSDSDREPGRFSVGGTVTGLATGDGLTLQNNGIDTLTLTGDGDFSFRTRLVDQTGFEVTILNQPETPAQECLIANGNGRISGGDIRNVAITCFPRIAFEASPLGDVIMLGWNAADFPGATFNLCQASEALAGGIANCASHDGGILTLDADSPVATAALATDTPYWFQLEVLHAGGLRTQSPQLVRSIPGGLAAGPFRGVNDTGIDWCGDSNGNLSANGLPEQKVAGCVQAVATHPGQDAVAGRDAAARAGTLVKTGSGVAGFDFTRICNNGAAAGTGGCPATPVLGSAPDNWGCTRDNITGLMWEVKPVAVNNLRSSSHLYSWFDPSATDNQGVQNAGFCAASPALCSTPEYNTDTHALVQAVNGQGLCGQTDWRLPTIDELHSISYLGRINPSVDQGGFPDAVNAPYWTSNGVAGFSTEAWYLNFANGNDGRDDKGSAYRARLVRGGPAVPATAADIADAAGSCLAGLTESTPSGEFTAIADGSIVRHVATGLEWQRCALGQRWDNGTCRGSSATFTWQQALVEADARDGWRLPNVKELRSIVERCHVAPAINQQVFPNAPAAAFMTSSPSAGNPDRTWVIHFLSGNDNLITRTSPAQVRLVRDGN